jgi:uncharacterized membrane protein
MTCITIASWMLAVVGAVMIILSLYPITRYITELSYHKTGFVFISCWGIAIGLIVFGIGITPYIPPITLPCITLTP